MEVAVIVLVCLVTEGVDRLHTLYKNSVQSRTEAQKRHREARDYYIRQMTIIEQEKNIETKVA